VKKTRRLRFSGRDYAFMFVNMDKRVEPRTTV
jgi:hypothetical protein